MCSWHALSSVCSLHSVYCVVFTLCAMDPQPSCGPIVTSLHDHHAQCVLWYSDRTMTTWDILNWSLFGVFWALTSCEPLHATVVTPVWSIIEPNQCRGDLSMVLLMTYNGPVKRLNCPKWPVFGPNYQGSEGRLALGSWYPDMELEETPDNSIKYRLSIRRNIKYRTHMEEDGYNPRS